MHDHTDMKTHGIGMAIVKPASGTGMARQHDTGGIFNVLTQKGHAGLKLG